MPIQRLNRGDPQYPDVLQELKSPPKQLYYDGPLLELLQRPRLAIVGSRNVTPYGKQVTLQLAGQLAEQGIVIISGLALGVDGLAHEATLAAEGQTIAVLPSAHDRLVPANNYQLAKGILKKGGAIVSEYPLGTPAMPFRFIDRNRIVAGLAQALLITEAREGSGALYTADFAEVMGIPVLALPGNINSLLSIGTNSLIKEGKAHFVTDVQDILDCLGIKAHRTHPADIKGTNAAEQGILDLLLRGVTDGNELLAESGLDISQFNQTMISLELAGTIRSLGQNQWALA